MHSPKVYPVRSASPKSASVPIMYRHTVRTILYYGIFALSFSEVMGIFRNGAILHVACTIGLSHLQNSRIADIGADKGAGFYSRNVIIERALTNSCRAGVHANCAGVVGWLWWYWRWRCGQNFRGFICWGFAKPKNRLLLASVN